MGVELLCCERRRRWFSKLLYGFGTSVARRGQRPADRGEASSMGIVGLKHESFHLELQVVP